MVCNATYLLLRKIQNKIKTAYPSVKFVQLSNLFINIFNRNGKKFSKQTEDNRAFRSFKENMIQVLRDYYFPKFLAF